MNVPLIVAGPAIVVLSAADAVLELEQRAIAGLMRVLIRRMEGLS